MSLRVNTSRALRTAEEQHALVCAVQAASAEDESDWIEWKTVLGLGLKADHFTLARHIIAMANRRVEEASRVAEGFGYILVGVEPGNRQGVEPVDPAVLSLGLERYLGWRGPRWTSFYDSIDGPPVLVITVDPPRPGDRIHTLEREFDRYRAGDVYVRKVGRTERADPGDMEYLTSRSQSADMSTLTRLIADHLPSGPSSGTQRRERASVRTPVLLPADPEHFFAGRAGPLEELLEHLRPIHGHPASPICVIAGMGGVGKTTLAIRAAHRARANGWFPGGILFIDQRGYSPDPALDAAACAEILLRALGAADDDLPPAPAGKILAWQALLNDLAEQGRAVLVVLDNVAGSSQVAPLVPSAPHRMLITSRRKLSDLAAQRVDLLQLSSGDAIELLDRALRTARAGDSRITVNPDEAKNLARLCGHLPLALQICAALLRDEPDRPLADQIADLQDASTRLQRLHYPDDEERGPVLAVAAAFDLSYARMNSRQVRAFHLLSLAPGPDFSVAVAAVLLGNPQPTAPRLLSDPQPEHAATRRLLADLQRASLVESRPGERWRMHDLIRLYAHEKSREHSEGDNRDANLDSLLASLWRTTLAAAHQLVAPQGTQVPEIFENAFTGLPDAMAWLDSERECLLAAVSLAYREHRAKRAWQLAASLSPYLHWHRQYQSWKQIAQIAVRAARDLGDREIEAHVTMELGIALEGLQDFDEAMTILQQALDIFTDLNKRSEQAAVLNNLAIVLNEKRRYDDAVNALRQVVHIYDETDDQLNKAVALSNLARTLGALGRLGEAVTAARQSIPRLHDAGHFRAEAQARQTLAEVLREQGHINDATAEATQAIEIYREIADRHSEGMALITLAGILHNKGQAGQVAAALRNARDVFRETGDRRLEAAVQQLLSPT